MTNNNNYLNFKISGGGGRGISSPPPPPSLYETLRNTQQYNSHLPLAELILIAASLSCIGVLAPLTLVFDSSPWYNATVLSIPSESSNTSSCDVGVDCCPRTCSRLALKGDMLRLLLWEGWVGVWCRNIGGYGPAGIAAGWKAVGRGWRQFDTIATCNSEQGGHDVT